MMLRSRVVSLIFVIAVGLAAATTGSRAQSVELMWSGGATHESIQVKARLDTQRSVRLAVSAAPDMADFTLSGQAFASSVLDQVASLSIAGLEADSRYYYAIAELDGSLSALRGSFQTFPAPGCQVPYDFKIAFGADAGVGSDALVFERIEEQNPDLFLHLGDMHYASNTTDELEDYRSAYRTVLTRPRQASLFRNVSSAYVWNDNDFGPNDADSTHVGREAAKRAFREYVPHHALVSDLFAAGVHRAFTLGRVRFIVTDNRYYRSPKGDVDDDSKTMLGVTQLAWFKQELLDARDQYELIIWINPVPWIEKSTSGSDRWGGYTTERADIANFIADNNIHQKLLMLSAGAHMIAADDGSFSGYATGTVPGGFPVIHAAAFDRDGSYRGGPYRLGAHPSTSQYGVLEIVDECLDRVSATFTGLDATGNTVTSTADFDVGNPITFDHNFLSGGIRLVSKRSVWKYDDSGEIPDLDWASPNFSDNSWPSGTAQFGYGDPVADSTGSDETKTLDYGFLEDFKHHAYYFRQKFNVTDASTIKGLNANILADDGAVVYLNGSEILRVNMPDGLITEETLADTVVEGSSEATYQTFGLNDAAGGLFSGINILAVEVHLQASDSPDLSFDMELFALTSEEAANIRPVATATANPMTGDAPLEVSFDGSQSEDPDGTIVSYAWDFGDEITSADPVVAHTYATVGTFDAILKVTDNLGRTDEVSFEIVATNPPPEAIIIATPPTGETPLEVVFDASASFDPHGSIVAYEWDLASGVVDTGVTASRIFDLPGTFMIKLQVIDDLGSRGIDSLEYSVAQGNLAPLPLGIPDQVMPEDTSQTQLALRDFFDDDRDPIENVDFALIVPDSQTLLSTADLDPETGVVLFIPAPDSNGTLSMIVRATDTKGLVSADTFSVIVRALNDAPSFVAGADTIVVTDDGAVSIAGWATAITTGPPDESGQSVTFDLQTAGSALFVVPPSVAADGTLSFEPAADTSGIATVSIVVMDDGGIDFGGVDRSEPAVISITTNHRPVATFTFERAGYESLTVNFDASSSSDSDGTIVSHRWDFGDGYTSEGVTIAHTFEDTALTDVFLTVTDNLGAQDATSGSVAVSNTVEEIPDQFAAGPSYPNPSSSVSQFDLSLPEAAEVRIEVIDVTGRTVIQYTNSIRPGTHRIPLGVGRLPSGIYFVRVTANTDQAVFNLTVVR